MNRMTGLPPIPSVCNMPHDPAAIPSPHPPRTPPHNLDAPVDRIIALYWQVVTIGPAASDWPLPTHGLTKAARDLPLAARTCLQNSSIALAFWTPAGYLRSSSI